MLDTGPVCGIVVLMSTRAFIFLIFCALGAIGGLSIGYLGGGYWFMLVWAFSVALGAVAADERIIHNR